MNSTKKSLWIFNHYAVTPDMPGGTRHYDFSKELIKRGYEVTIFASSFHYNQHKETKLSPKENWKMEEVDGIKFLWIRTFPYYKNNWRRVLSMFSYMIRSYDIARNISRIGLKIQEPDVIIGSSVHLLAPLAAYFLSKYYKAHFIMEIRDLWPQTLIEIGQMSMYHPFIIMLHFLEKFLYKRTDRIITLLPLANEYITSFGIDAKKIAWVPNGVDLDRFKNIPKNKMTGPQFKVMYLGAHGQADALNILLKAAKVTEDKKYTNIQFILTGDGAQKQNLIDLKKRLKLSNMEFRPPVKKTYVPSILEEADVLVTLMKDAIIYKYGVSSNKEYDYAVSTKPIIISGNAPNNIVEAARCGIIVPPEDPEALAGAIIRLYHMAKKERDTMGKRGREYVEKYHSIPFLVDTLEKVFNEVCSEKEIFLHKKYNIFNQYKDKNN